MRMSNEIRKHIKSMLTELTADLRPKGIYYQLAEENCPFPYVVFDLDNVGTLMNDMNKRNYTLIIDIFTRDTAYAAEDTFDRIADAMNGVNYVLDSCIISLFYQTGGRVEEKDKYIVHRQIRVEVQVYPV